MLLFLTSLGEHNWKEDAGRDSEDFEEPWFNSLADNLSLFIFAIDFWEAENGIGDDEIEEFLLELLFMGELIWDSLYHREVEDDRTSNYYFLFESKSIIC